jgi:hypothetical protein
MAKKGTKGAQLSLDDYDFGSEFDFEEFDLEPKPVKTKREAVERVGAGVLEGAKGAIKSPTFFRELVRNALPRGYGDALDLADQALSTTRELYNEGAKEAKPALKEVARVVDKLLPAGSKNVPKPVDKLLRKFVDANKSYSPSGLTNSNPNDLAVSALLQETFKYTSTEESRREAKSDARQGIQDAISADRHSDNVNQLDGIRNAVVSMAAYQRRIEFGYQKKSLELAARHYYVSVDTLNEHKRQNVRTTEMLSGILNNTALPDLLKMKTSEKFIDMMRNKAMAGLQDGIFGQRNNFMQNIGKAFRDQALGSVRAFAGGAIDGAQGLEMSADVAEQAKEMGFDRYRTMGNLVGGEGTRFAAKLGATRVGKAITGGSGGLTKGIRRLGGRLQFGVENAPQIATDFSNSAVDGEEYAQRALDSIAGDRLSDGKKRALSGIAGSVANPILDLLRGTIRRANAQDTEVREGGIGELTAPAAFTNQAHRSLIEAIPGYLARILQEQQIARTGDTSIDLIQFDYAKGGFTKTKALRKALFNKLFDEDSKKGVQREKDQLLEIVDPGATLTPEQRKELSKILMNDNLRGRAGYETGRIGNYTNGYNFGESTNGDQFAELFKKLAEKDKANDTGQVSNDFASRFRGVGRSASERRGNIQQLLDVYPRETLEDMGLLQPGSKKIDMDRIHSYFGGEEYEAKGIRAEGGLRVLPGGRGPRTRIINRQGPTPPPTPQVTGGDPVNETNPLLEELKRLIEITENQNAKPVLAEIKDILVAMQTRPEPAGPATPSAANRVIDGAVDLGRTAAGLAGEAARNAMSGARRLRRRATVAGNRFINENQDTIDAARSQVESAARRASVMGRRALRQQRGPANNLRDRAEEMWNDRPGLEELRDMLSERLSQVGAAASSTMNNVRERAGIAGSRLRQRAQERTTATPPSAEDAASAEHRATVLGEIKDILTSIKERLEDGIMTMGYPEDGQLPPGILRRAGGAARRGLSRLNMRLSDVAKGLWKGGKKIVGMGASIGNSIAGNVLGTAWKLTKGVSGIAGDIVGGAAGGAYRRARGFVDIYVGNEKKPRMYGRMLQEGNVYFDKATNKPIRRLKDITGTVVKRTSAGEEVVLEDTEIENAWQREGPVKKTLKAMGVVVKTAAKLGNGLVGMVMAGIPPVYRAALFGVKKAWGLLDLPQDIFVKDRLDSPAMTAVLMRAGSYTSAVSGKAITKPSMIDGPVLIGDETVLTHDDIRKGLVDKNNKPIKTGLRKLLSFAFGGIKSGLKLAAKAGKMVNNAAMGLAKGGMKLGGKLVKGAVSVGGGAFDLLRGRNPFRQGQAGEVSAQTAQVAAESVSYLKEIRDLLKDRLPTARKKIAGDVDGDGDRDGSYEDQMASKKKVEDAKAAATAQPGAVPKPGAGGVGIMGGLKAMWDKFRGKKKKGEDEEDDEDGDINIDMDGDGRRGRGRPRPPRAAPKGFWGKAGHYGKQGLKLGGKALSWGAKGAMALTGLSGLGLGGAAMGAGSAIAGGVASAAGAIATGAGALATGIAGLISAPVLLGAAAIAGVAIGGYYAYKYLTKKKLGLLSRIRYTQYGFFPSDNDHVNAVFGLEDKLKEMIVYSKDGAKLDPKRVDHKDLLKDFDVDEDDKEALNNWLRWFSGRFKPVFLTHVTALKGTAGDKWLSDTDDLEPDVALKYLNATRFPEGPYNDDTSPFKDLKSLPASGGDVKAIIQLAEEELKKKVKAGPKTGAEVAGGVIAGATAAGVANPVSGLNNGPDQPATAGSGISASGISQKVLTEAAKGAIGAGQLTGGQVAAAGSSAVLQSLGVDRLDGLDVVRLKSYGLVKMELEKVRSIMALEKDVTENLRFDKNVANWSGSLEQILSKNGPAFGVDLSNESRTANWLNWFNQRFLPVYLNYATLIKAQTGKDVPADGKIALKPNQIVDVATGLFTTSGNGGSVWNVSASPWDSYEMNGDVRSTDGNMQGLKDSAKAAVLAEPGGKSANQPSANKSSANSTSSEAPKSITQKVGGAISSMWQSVKDTVTGTSTTKPGYTSGPPVGGGAGTAGGIPSDMGGGREVNHPGQGTAGDINQIPKPTGNKSWAALKDTILSAAKMVGVDGKLMAAMAAIESGFDYTVKAGTSSASGLYQFITDTWNMMVKKYGGKYGIGPGTSPTDPRANALMGAEYIKDNMAALEGKLGRPITDTDVYFAHFLGSGGAKKFLTADPNAIGATLLPAAANANKGIFYAKDGTPLTVGQIYQLVNDRVKNKAKGFGINDGGEALVDSSATAKGVPGTTSDKGAAGGKAGAAIAGSPSDAKKDAGAPTTPAPATSAASSSPAPAAKTPGTSAYGLGATVQKPTADASGTPAPTSAPASGPTSNGIPIGVLASGFTPARSLNDQFGAAKQQNDVRVSNLKDTNDILSKSYETLGTISNTLSDIKGLLGVGASGAKAAEASGNSNAIPTSQSARNADKRVKDLPKPPISVARPAAPY